MKAECCSACEGLYGAQSSPAHGACGHGHETGQDSRADHGEGEGASRGEVFLLVGCALCYALVLIFEDYLGAEAGPWAVRCLYAVPYLMCGLSIFRIACRLICKGDILNEFTLMGGATLVAIALDQSAEAAGVMLFYRIGEYFQELAAYKSRASIQSLLASKLTTAHILKGDTVVTVPVESVGIDECIVVRAGERVPLDGRVLSGSSSLDQAALTGESVPVSVAEGDAVMGGSINMGGVLTIKVTSGFADTHMARILEMVENAAQHKAPTERFLTRFARYYTPAVVFLAFFVAVLPPLFAGHAWNTWIYRALVLLVISCPCALVLSIPLSYFGGIGAASRKGILVKGGTVLDGLTHLDLVVFDKTGTLTKGVFEVTRLAPQQGVSEEELLRGAVLAESESNHPIAVSIMRRAGGDFTRPVDLVVTEIPGKGMAATTEQHRYLAGSIKLMHSEGVAVSEAETSDAVVYVAKDGAYLGCIEAADIIKPESKDAVAALKKRGLRVVMLSGDRKPVAERVAKETGIEEYEAELLPEGKVETLTRLAARDKAAFVGDGINDAPILALSRVGIAMGGIGAQAAVEAADAVILNDSPARVVELFALGDKVRAIVWQNIVMALGVKSAFMALGIVGISGLWEAIFADVGVALLAVLNASRAMRE